MSAENGGRGRPPVPPEGHGPPQQQQVVIGKEVTYRPVMTDAKRTEDGLIVAFLVSEGGEPVQHRYLVGPPGKKNLQEAVNGGIEVASADAMPEGER